MSRIQYRKADYNPEVEPTNKVVKCPLCKKWHVVKISRLNKRFCYCPRWYIPIFFNPGVGEKWFIKHHMTESEAIASGEGVDY